MLCYVMLFIFFENAMLVILIIYHSLYFNIVKFIHYTYTVFLQGGSIHLFKRRKN